MQSFIISPVAIRVAAVFVLFLTTCASAYAQHNRHDDFKELVAATSEAQSPVVVFRRPAKERRGGDAQGCGGFHCSRGTRLHLANDYTCMPGDRVIASADGVVEKVGWSKTGFGHVRYVRVKVSPRLIYETHYVTIPLVSAGETVKVGQGLGVCANLSEMYPSARGMKNHVHQYVEWDGILIDAENHTAIVTVY